MKFQSLKFRNFAFVAVLALGGCPKPDQPAPDAGPPPIPSPSTIVYEDGGEWETGPEGDRARAVCARLVELQCEEGRRANCARAFAHFMEAHLIEVNSACILADTTKTKAAVRVCGIDCP